ncbi:MAG: TatD family hydrolase [Muribaculaceae bacterium]|nr:TatD family hydrolase [Muribaculaceae bacterium]
MTDISSDILDIHTHLPAPRPDGVIAASPDELRGLYEQFPKQLWAVGYHPWEIPSTGLTETQLQTLTEVAGLPRVVAIGETGIDKARIEDIPLFAQINAFNRHMELARSLAKPLILHAVKAQDVLIPMLRDCGVPVVIHGFRQKPSIADMYLNAGCYLSYGAQFNADSVAVTPADRLLAETDCNDLTIEAVIGQLRAVRPDITTDTIAVNTARLLRQQL